MSVTVEIHSKCVYFQAISCHYAACECYYIDVKGTIQEMFGKEIEEVAKRRLGPDSNLSFQVTVVVHYANSKLIYVFRKFGNTEPGLFQVSGVAYNKKFYFLFCFFIVKG